MCVSFLSIHQNKRFPFIMALNRDEFYNRPTLPLDHWKEKAYIIGGRDLQDNGTWLAIDCSGRFAAVTNFRDGIKASEKKRSRGLLVSDFLDSNLSAMEYLSDLSKDRQNYRGYNILLGSIDQVFHYSNISDKVIVLENGIHGLSNHFLNTPWPKVLLGKKKFSEILHCMEDFPYKPIFDLMKNQSLPPDELLPSTGVSIEIEKLVSSIFIESEKYSYGTRSTSIIFYDSTIQAFRFVERTFIPFSSDYEDREIEIKL